MARWHFGSAACFPCPYLQIAGMFRQGAFSRPRRALTLKPATHTAACDFADQATGRAKRNRVNESVVTLSSEFSYRQSPGLRANFAAWTFCSYSSPWRSKTRLSSGGGAASAVRGCCVGRTNPDRAITLASPRAYSVRVRYHRLLSAQDSTGGGIRLVKSIATSSSGSFRPEAKTGRRSMQGGCTARLVRKRFDHFRSGSATGLYHTGSIKLPIALCVRADQSAGPAKWEQRSALCARPDCGHEQRKSALGQKRSLREYAWLLRQVGLDPFGSVPLRRGALRPFSVFDRTPRNSHATTVWRRLFSPLVSAV